MQAQIIFILLALSFSLPVYGQSSLAGMDIATNYQFTQAGDGGTLEVDGFPKGQRLYYADNDFSEFGFADFKFPIKYTQDTSIHLSWFDYSLHFALPLDILFSFGGGLGRALVEGPTASDFSSSLAGEYHFTLGYNFFESLHLRYSQSKVLAPIKRNDNLYLSASGTLTSLGVALVF